MKAKESEQTMQPAPTTSATFDMAQTKAEAGHPGVAIIGVDVENEPGLSVFRFHFHDGARIDVDAKTGEVVALYTPGGSND